MKSLTAAELRQWIEAEKPFLLVDVRESFEREAAHIGGMHLPMSQFPEGWSALRQAVPVVVYCAKGIRSAIAIQRLEGVVGMPAMYNLEGGLQRWDQDS